MERDVVRDDRIPSCAKGALYIQFGVRLVPMALLKAGKMILDFRDTPPGH